MDETQKSKFFNFKSERFQIVLLFFFGAILRFISARNIGVAADDVNHAIRPINIFSSGKLVIWDQSTALWYYIQGIFYNFFGNTHIASRFANIIFGSLLIVLVFVFIKRIFGSQRVAFFSALLIAVSPMLIKSTLPEMDTLAAFMTLLSVMFFYDFMKNQSMKKIALAALFIGIGIMVKLYVLFFGLSMTALLIVYLFRNVERKKAIKTMFIWSIIVTILVVPTITHNYLLYKDKGFMDLIFTNTLRIGTETAAEYYNWGAGWLAYTDYKGFFLGNQRNFDPTPLPGFMIVLGMLFKGDPLLSILFIMGLATVWKTNRKYLLIFAIIFLPAFTYLGAQIPLSKHFIWAIVLAAPVSGLAVDKILDLGMKKKIAVILIIIFSLLYLGMPKGVVHSHFYGQSAFGELNSLKDKFPDGAIVVADSRIYRGMIHWGLADTNYVEASSFFQIAQQTSTAGQPRDFEVYYIECVLDDCGWGTVAGQPEFNKSMEEVTSFFSERAYTVVEIDEPDRNNYYAPLFGEKQVIFRVYKTDLPLSSVVPSAIKSTHSWYLYPVGYDRSISEIFDDYNTVSFGDLTLQWISFKIIYFEMIITMLTIPMVFYLLWRHS